MSAPFELLNSKSDNNLSKSSAMMMVASRNKVIDGLDSTLKEEALMSDRLKGRDIDNHASSGGQSSLVTNGNSLVYSDDPSVSIRMSVNLQTQSGAPHDMQPRAVTPDGDPATPLPISTGSSILESRAPTLPTHTASLVLKNELQRVLTVMRAQGTSRYVAASRFTGEFVDHVHPVAQRMEELHQSLSNELSESDLSAGVDVFCDAVQGRDVSAAITGAALSALHKLLVYGMIREKEMLMQLSTSLVNCKFEDIAEDSKSSNFTTPTTTPATTAPVVARRLSSASVHQSSKFQDEEEEQVAYMLLDLSALVLRNLLVSQVASDRTDIVSGLLENCWHAVLKSQRTSPILRSAATKSLSDVVLFAFGSGQLASTAFTRQALLRLIASLLSGSSNDPNTPAPLHHSIRTALSLLNLSLETSTGGFSVPELHVIQDEMCKNLLLAANKDDVLILTDTLRVVSNLLPLRHHLKVQLEVLLTNMHLRVLRASSESSNEEREVVLESLLSCCQEPNFMVDLYYNYDCDVACTNLYEAIVSALGKASMPPGWIPPFELESVESNSAAPTTISSAPATLEGIRPQATSASGASTAQRQGPSNGSKTNNRPSLKNHLEATNPKANAPPVAAVAAATVAGNDVAATAVAVNFPLTHLNRLAIEALFAVLESICHRRTQLHVSVSNCSETELDVLPRDSHEELQEVFLLRKRKKTALSKVSHVFNVSPMSPEWLDLAVAEGQLEDDRSARGVAELLFTAPGLNKIKVGEYLSKGPTKDFPFQASVRNEFAALFDFSDITFPTALRKFLSKFRLPGEAQCIDRLMEAFSIELYKQQGESSFFKNSDAIYVLSFSTIMLNTDLHNPTIKKENRMTLKQFIRNNRGINGGEDLSEAFLTELYEQIKDKQIQVRREMTEVMMKHDHDVDFRTAWEGILAKTHELATPFSPQGRDLRQTSTSSVAHDKEMFTVLARWLVHSLSSAFLRSWDDALVVRTLSGMKSMAKLAVQFDLDWILDDILKALLPMGRDYISGCVALDYATVGDNASVVSALSRTVGSTETGVDDDDTTTCESELPIPYGLLSTRDEKVHRPEVYGSASHRGILALDCSFGLLHKYSSRVSNAWPGFIECLCGLRDARALPTGLADLDDFADSNGNVLPLSTFAKASQRRIDEYYRAKSDPEASKQKGWFRSFFRKSSNDKDTDPFEGDDYVAIDRGELSSYSRALLGIAESADVENVIQTCSTRTATAEITIRALLEVVGQYPFDDDPVLEQHAVFAMELAARALLSNKERASDLFAIFLSQFESILGRVSEGSIPSPFVLERLVVTVLRACIHLYDLSELRPHLRASLHLLTMVLPKGFMRQIADRMACGMAIILRSSFQYFETPNEWSFMGDTLDMLAQHDRARVFVFDGIASTVEYALPQSDASDDAPDNGCDGNRPQLTAEACTALSKILFRFILGFYKNDYSLNVPAMLCLEKMYRHKVELLLKDEADLRDEGDDGGSGSGDPSSPADVNTVAPDKDLWQNLAVAVYACCRSSDPEVSQHGCECYQRVILNTAVDQIPDEKWIAILYLMVNKQPPLVATESRRNCFTLLGQLLVRVVPELSHKPDNRDDLYDLLASTASLAHENLRSQGRRGSVSPLFDATLQTVTYLSNHMATDEWKGEAEFSAWASETLLSELERVGAAGATLQSKAAATAPPAAAATQLGSVSETDPTEARA